MYKKIILVFLLVFSLNNISAQENNETYIEFNFGRGVHATGDIAGYQFGFLFGESISKKWDWTVAFEGSLHDEEDVPLVFEDPSTGIEINSTLHNVTAGLQLASGMKYNFVNSDYHNFSVAIAALLRYQATSLADAIVTDYPALTGHPIPIRTIINEEPSRTFAIGGSLRVQYNYKFNVKNALGLGGHFQADTNGDNLMCYFLSFKRNL